MKRIQRRRDKGWRMPPNTVYVGRPTKWGNPFDWRRCQELYGVGAWEAKRRVKDIFRQALRGRGNRMTEDYSAHFDRIRRDISELRGFDLACWCPLDEPCHADALLELANKEKQ